MRHQAHRRKRGKKAMPRMHTVPTHLKTPETILSLAGVNLSIRQFLLVLIGASLSYRLWLFLGFLNGFLPGRLLVAVLPFGLALLVAFVQLAGRSLEVWLLVVLRFAVRPHILV